MVYTHGGPTAAHLIRRWSRRILALWQMAMARVRLAIQPYQGGRAQHSPQHRTHGTRQRLREAIRLCLHLAAQPAYRDIIAVRITPTDQDLTSDDALDTWMLKTVGTARHISGTCKMGPASDPMAVVNQYGLVYGTERLRVVDGAILPHVTRANTHATIIMATERVAAWI